MASLLYTANFEPKDIPDLTGKVAIVTGANSGIGLNTALELARHHAHVFVGSRSPDKGKAAIDTIKKEVPDANVELLQLNLSSLHDVKTAADAFMARDLPLHILVNNAGIMAPPFSQTTDGIESQLGVNHVAHHLFVSQLADKLKTSGTPESPSRLVYVSSFGHNLAPSTGCAIGAMDKEETYSRWPAYGRSKLANILDTRGWVKHFGDAPVLANVLHPGAVNTELYEKSSHAAGITATILQGVKSVAGWFMVTPAQGSYTSLFAATSPQVVENKWTGQYFVPYGKLSETSKQGKDEVARDALWEWTEETIQKILAK